MTSPDIRAGISLLIAALSAKGKSEVHRIYHLDRGYESINNKLKIIGANIPESPGNWSANFRIKVSRSVFSLSSFAPKRWHIFSRFS